MSINREQKLHADILLNDKMTVEDDLQHNRREVKRLEKLATAERNQENAEILENSIDIGYKAVMKKRHQLKNLSMAKIAALVGVDVRTLKCYEQSACSPEVVRL